MNILVSGAAGFIGSRVMKALAEKGFNVIGIDNINDYYDVRLKYARLEQCGIDTKEACWESNIVESRMLPQCKFIRMDIGDCETMNRLFRRYHFDKTHPRTMGAFRARQESAVAQYLLGVQSYWQCSAVYLWLPT